jgi:hypothetical protein
MIETLIAAALVLVPLFLAIPVIAKYQDIKAYVVQGARYAAWERTVWFGGEAAEEMGIGGASTKNKWDANDKSDDAIRAEIGARLLSGGSAGFSSSDQSGSSYANPRRLWVDRRGNTLLDKYSDISNTTGGGHTALGEYKASLASEKAPGLINDLLTPVVGLTSIISNFTVDTRGQYTANVGLKVQQVAFNTNAGLGPCVGCPIDYLTTGTTMGFTAKNVLVANSWSANGPGSLADYDEHPEKITVYNQIRGLTPTSLLKPSGGVFKTVMDILKGISLVFFPELSTLDLGRIEVDKVPADRLE